MRLGTLLVFDNLISTTTPTWYSGSEFNRQIGMGSHFAIHAFVSSVTGGPTLEIRSEHSTDGEQWIATGTTEFNGTIMQNTAYAASYGVGQSLAAHVRFRIRLTAGTNPSCRLKLYVTPRANASG